jgi:hypothetical protein
MKWKYISSLKTRIYLKWFPNASAVTWSLVLQTRNLANKIVEFWKCDDFSGEISSAHRYWLYSWRYGYKMPEENGQTDGRHLNGYLTSSAMLS